MKKQPSFLLYTAETAPTFAGDGLNALLFARTLVKKNFRASIICLNPNKLLPNIDFIEGVSIKRIPYRYSSMLGRILLRLRMLVGIIKYGQNYSTWLIYGAMPAHRLIILVGWLLNCKVIFRSTLYGFDNANELIRSKSPILRFFNRKIYGHTSAYYALNKSFRNEWQQIFNNDANVFLSSQGTDLSLYETPKFSKLQLRDKLNLPQNKTIILMVGHLIKRKGFPEVFEWLSRVNEDFLLVHVGRNIAPAWDAVSVKNPEMADLKIIGEKLLGNKVCFVGESNNAPLYYQTADVFLMASYSEGFPSNSINEAMAAGLTIITRRIEGSSDYIVDGVNGLFFESEVEFGVGFKELLHNAELRNRLGKKSKEFSFSNNRIEDVVDKFIAFNKELDSSRNT